MAGRNKIELARKVFSKYDGQSFGVEALKNIVRVNLSSDENNVVSYLRAMRDVGILTEGPQFRFKVNTKAEAIIKDDQTTF